MPVSSIEGCVKAVSLVLRLNPRKFFVELSCNEKTVVIVAQEKQECWQDVLTVNSAFRFSRLVKKNCSFKGRHQSYSINVWCATADSTCVQVPFVSPLSLQICSSWRKVTGVFQPLALYQIENSLHLSVTFMLQHAHVPDLLPGQDIIVLDGHVVRDCIFICGRSRLIVRDESYSVSPIPKYSSALVSLITKFNLSIQDVFWLKTQHDIFEQKFCDNFLQKMGVVSELCPGLREKVLSMAVRFISPHTATRSVMEEFVEHTQCGLDRPAAFTSCFLTLVDIISNCPVVDSSMSWWHSSVEYTLNLPEMPLVAYFETVDGQWMLKDSTQSVPCILTYLVNPGAMLPFIGNFIALTRFYVVWESFKTQTGAVNYTYLVVAAKELQLVYDMQKKLRECGSTCTYCGRTVNASHVCIKYNIPMVNNQDVVWEKCLLTSSKWDVLLKKRLSNGFVSMSCGSHNSRASSVCIRVLHKSAVRVFPQRKDPRSYILGLLLEDDTRQEGPCSKLCYVEIHGRLLMLLPLLDTDAVYSLRLPEDFNMPARQAPGFLESVIKTDGIIVLPEDSGFYHVQFSQKFKNYYSVSESLQEGYSRDLMDLEAIITSRTHVDPMFNSEKVTVTETGFGVPSSRTILLRLKDKEGGPETNAYLKCGHCRYPIGLLPGNYVRLTMLEKRMTAKGVYFSSTALTTVELLAVDQTKGIATEQNWGDSCLLLHTPPTKQLVWGTVVLSRLLKVCLKVVCNNCGCLLQGDSCGFVGCYNKSEVKTSALLTAIVADACGKAILIVKDELVQQVLQFSNAQWLSLQKLARQNGELLYLFKEKVQMNDPQTLGQEVFKMYCSVVAQNKTFILHVRCRKYAAETNKGFSHSLPVLYCVDMRRYRPTTAKSMMLD